MGYIQSSRVIARKECEVHRGQPGLLLSAELKKHLAARSESLENDRSLNSVSIEPAFPTMHRLFITSLAFRSRSLVSNSCALSSYFDDTGPYL